MNSPLHNKRDTIRILLLTLAAIAVGLAAITNQSLWMDEGSGAFKALIPNFKDWWAMTLRLGGSDVQMPVYMFLLWGWVQLGALSEFALRAINLPWLILAVLALRKVRFWPLVCLVSPFVLHYVGELRPYAMQIAAGSIAAAAFGRIIAAKEGSFGGLHALCGTCLLLTASSLTGVVWAAGVATGLCVARTDWLRDRRFWLCVLPWLGGAVVMAGYYGFTLLSGYRATAIPGSGITSVFFGFYEMIGLLGLGPGRSELRADPFVVSRYLWWLLPAFLCITGAWCFGMCAWMKTAARRSIVAVTCAVLLPIVVLAVLGMMQDFRVLGRHMSPAIPAVLLPIAATFDTSGRSRLKGILLGTLAVAFMLASSASLRFLEKHARDDYRRATAIGIDALKKGKSVWWQADMNATRYYAYRSGGMPLVNAIQVLESSPPTSLMFADVIVVNRPDLHFRIKDYQKEIKKNFFKLDSSFTGFEVWKVD